MDGYCGRCSGIKVLVLGVIFLANAFLFKWDPWTLIGALLVIGGIVHIVKPSCGCGSGCCMPTDAPLKKKKR